MRDGDGVAHVGYDVMVIRKSRENTNLKKKNISQEHGKERGKGGVRIGKTAGRKKK